MGKVTLPSRDALMRRLRACDDDPEREQKLLPLICDYLYQNDGSVDIEWLGSSLISALKWYVDGLQSPRTRLQTVTVLHNRLDDYVSAISFTFTAQQKANLWTYCNDKKMELKP